MDRSLISHLVSVHPAASNSCREKNNHDVRGDHSQNHYAAYDSILFPRIT